MLVRRGSGVSRESRQAKGQAWWRAGGEKTDLAWITTKDADDVGADLLPVGEGWEALRHFGSVSEGS
jgi:hypothetical protein